MQQNPVAVMVLITCIVPLALVMFGVWIGKGRPLPGGRRFVIGVKNGRGTTPYDDE